MVLSGCGAETLLRDRVLTVRLWGEIDHHNAGRLRNDIDAAILKERPLRVVLELGEIDFMDSSGLGLIMGRYALSSKLGADLVLRDPSPRVAKVLRLAGIGRMLRIETSKPETPKQGKDGQPQ